MSQMRFDFDKKSDPELPFPEFANKANKANKVKELKEITMHQAAKYCGVSYNKFLSVLTSKQIIGKSTQGRYLPFQKYLERRWFIQRGEIVDRRGFRGLVQKVTVTPLGYSEIKKIIHGE